MWQSCRNFEGVEEDSAILNFSIARFEVILIVLTPFIIFLHYYLLNVIAIKNERSFIL